jgi:hypothetical protein
VERDRPDTDDRDPPREATPGGRRSPSRAQSASETTPDGRAVDGATDREIAERLAAVEEGDSDSTGDEGVEAGDSDSTGDEGVETEEWEEKQSAAKRFINRAIDVIDRSDD